MDELIKIETENGDNFVNARRLHEFLESKQRFTDWIRKRIQEFGFKENKDYLIYYYDYQGNLLTSRLHKNMKPDIQGGRIDYLVNLEMAKHLALVEKTTAGKQVRDYFIAVENRFKSFLYPSRGEMP